MLGKVFPKLSNSVHDFKVTANMRGINKYKESVKNVRNKDKIRNSYNPSGSNCR